MPEVRTTCCYCGTGCGVIAQVEGARIVGVRGDPDHPSSRGRLCTKGSTLHLTMTEGAMAGRARHPEVRRRREASRERASWDDALDFLADRFAAIVREHGPDAVAFYVSGQLLTEDYYVFNKLAKGLIGTANIDTNSRLCMSSAVSGYVKTLGADAPPNCYDDIEAADCLFIAGSNTAFAHPVLFRRIEAARERNPALRMIVVDPRRTQTAAAADLHLAIVPGTDVALFNAMLHAMLWEALCDTRFIEAHTAGLGALRESVRDCSPEWAAHICGVPAEDIVAAARTFASSRATLSLYCQGLNQSSSGTAKNAALVNLHLATAQIGRAGAGPFSLTGQPNAMGGREVGGLATQLAAHRDLANPAHRAEIARLWGVARVPHKPGLTAVELFAALKAKRVKAVWIACTNPAQSMPDQPNVRAALEAAELVVLQEAYADTETAAFADVLLPATSWGEKDGTVTNSERRISRVRAALPKPWEARHDWEIACEFGRRLEGRLDPRLRGDGETLFPYSTPEQIWNEHREATRGRDLDITGLSYAMLDDRGPQFWPFPEGAREGKARLYEDCVFPAPDGRARFYVTPYKAPADAVSARWPLRLTTGRLRDQWHGMTRTGTLASLFGHAPEPRLSMSANDLASRGLAKGDIARVDSPRGALHVIVEADEAVRTGQAYLPMHWGKRFLGGRESAGVNTVTSAAMDPISRQPELKHAAVRVTGAELPWRCVAFAEMDEAGIAHRLGALESLQPEVTFMSVVPMGRDRAGLLVRAAHESAPQARWLLQLDTWLGLAGDNMLRYDDLRRGHSRRLRIADDRLLAVRLTGDASAITSGEWLREWLVSGKPVSDVRKLLLSPATHAPSGFVLSGRVVCQCFNVAEAEIRAALPLLPGDPLARVQALGERLKCGTNCGSCKPELRALAERIAPAAGRMVA